MERVLASEQRRGDFTGDDLSFDRPTSACLLGSALLAALAAAARGCLDGANLQEFLAEVHSARVCAAPLAADCLRAHRA